MLNRIIVPVFLLPILLVLFYIKVIRKRAAASSFQLLLFGCTMILYLMYTYFPMPYQKSLIADSVYFYQDFSMVPFESYRMLYLQPDSSVEKAQVLQLIIREEALIPIAVAIPVGFCIRLGNKKGKAALLFLLFAVLNELLKWLTCTIVGANYLFVSLDGIIYSFIGCCLGWLFLSLLRIIIKKAEFSSQVVNELKQFVLKHSC